MDATSLSRPNPSSGTPVYLQLVEQVCRGLETGALRPGDALPAVSPVAEALVVPPAAVLRAYRELEQRHLAVRTGGVLYAAQAAREALARKSRPDDSGQAARLHELESASEMQRCLLPRIDTVVEGLDYAGITRAASSVGGDYYDFVPLPGGRIAIALGDVCGKGVPAAILMAAIRGYLHGATVERQCHPQDLVSALNAHLHASLPANRFATFFYGVYDVATRSLEYVTAGHHPPVVLRRNAVSTYTFRLGGGGLALGMMADAEYTAARVTLEPGDLLLAFSDGMTEAMDTAGDEWGETRLVEALEAAGTARARTVAEAVLASADRFTHGAPQHDDMTLAVVRVL